MSDCVCPTHIYRDKDGYPRAKHQGRLWRLNRLIWTLSYGEIPDGKVVGHTCNNTGCINITHLYLTTSHENSTHAARDGLYRTGSDHPKFKAKPDLVNEVIRLYDEDGLSQDKIANYFGLSQSTVSEWIRNNKGNNGKK